MVFMRRKIVFAQSPKTADFFLFPFARVQPRFVLCDCGSQLYSHLMICVCIWQLDLSFYFVVIKLAGFSLCANVYMRLEICDFKNILYWNLNYVVYQYKGNYYSLLSRVEDKLRIHVLPVCKNLYLRNRKETRNLNT